MYVKEYNRKGYNARISQMGPGMHCDTVGPAQFLAHVCESENIFRSLQSLAFKEFFLIRVFILILQT